MLEPEWAFASLGDVMDLVERLLGDIVARVLEENRTELLQLERDVAALEKIVPPFPRMRYEDAAKTLAQKTGFRTGADFGAPDEEALTEGLDKPLLVHHWPHEVKAFYGHFHAFARFDYPVPRTGWPGYPRRLAYLQQLSGAAEL
jgi:asparaginyl-tRNA synthetase